MHRYNAESTADRLNHLADYQHKAVTNSIDEVLYSPPPLFF